MWTFWVLWQVVNVIIFKRLGICLFQGGTVEQLHCRFQQNQIYTYIGDILVAVNPFIDLGLYTDMVSGF